MIIGVRAHDYGKMGVKKLLHTISGDGWQTVQLAFTKAVEGVGAFHEVTQEIIRETKSALDDTGLSVAVLGVYVEPSYVDDSRRRTQADILSSAFPQAKALCARCVGTETTSMKKQPGIARSEALVALRRTLEEILPEAELLGVDVAVEPVHYHTLNTPELAGELLRDMASPRLKIIFDPVNLLRLEDIAVQEALWKRCVERFGASISAIHIKGASHEADGDGVLLPASFADSVVDYPSLFAVLRDIDAPILRELAIPAQAQQDYAFISNSISRT